MNTPVWSTSCVDWERRIVAGRTLIPFKPLFPNEAAEALAVFKALRIVDAAGSPTFGEACEGWVFDFVAAVFGAYDPESGRRLIRKFLLLIAKKNSKSTIAAGIMMTALIRNWRLSAELLILAPTIEVAQNSFKPAADMVRADEELADLLHVQDHYRTITHRETRAELKVVAADNDTVSGKKAAFVLVDELWAFGSKPKADAMLREATGGLVSRPEGFVISLSTQSDTPPAGVFKADLQYFRDVRDGKIDDPKSLGVLYEFPRAMVESKAYRDPANFYITNPNIGRSVSAEWLEDELRKEMARGPETRATFLAKHLNLEIGMALRADRWAGADHWQAQAEVGLTFAEILRRSEVVTVGGDGGGLDDMLAIAVLGRCKTTRKWLLWVHAWIHESVLQLRKSEAARFRDFERDGDLTIVKRQEDAFIAFAEYVEQVNDAGLLAKVGLDPYGVWMIVEEMARRSITQEGGQVEGVSQGYKLTGTIKTAEVQLADGNLIHCGQALMAWCVSNAKVEPKGNAIVVTKQASGAGKIDPVMSAFNAVKLMAENPQPVQAPEYTMLFV